MSHAAARTSHVSPQGNDAWDGSQPAVASGGAGPFRTLGRARDAMRSARRQNPRQAMVVELQAGDYPQAATFGLSKEDGGTAEAPVTWKAAANAGERVRLLGGAVVPRWDPVTDPAVRERLAPEARAHVVAADLGALGIKDLGTLRSRGFGRSVVPSHLELFFAGRPMTLARWPNEGQSAHIAAFAKPLAEGTSKGETGATLTPPAAPSSAHAIAVWRP